MMYYLRPGEEELREIERRQAKKISAALTGKKTPPTSAVIRKLKDKTMSYYDTCAFPKPQDKKPKKKVNGYKEKPKRICYYCGSTGAERHEVYPGRGKRQICIDYGFQVDLCSECHRQLHENATPQAQERNQYWKEHYQKKSEQKLIELGISPEQAREMWIALIGRSYL